MPLVEPILLELIACDIPISEALISLQILMVEVILDRVCCPVLTFEFSFQFFIENALVILHSLAHCVR